MDVISPAGFQHFRAIRRRRLSKVKLVYRPIISKDSTFGLVIMRSNTLGSVLIRIRSQKGARDESGFLHDADPSPRQGLAAVPPRRPRSVPAGRSTGVYRSLCRRTRD